jgi:signal transduction histidine kinase
VTDVAKIALAARVFTIAALTSMAALSGGDYLDGAWLVVLSAAGALALSHATSSPQWGVALVEGCVVAFLAVLTHPFEATVTPYLVVPALIAGLDAGRRGMWRVVLTEFGVLLLVWLLWDGTWDRSMAVNGFTWLATAIGVGTMGVALRRAVSTSDVDPSYRSAVHLIRRLDALSGRLSGGLDAVGIAEDALSDLDAAVPTRHSAVLVRSRAGEVLPLRLSPGALVAGMLEDATFAEGCWRAASVVAGRRVGVPLTAGDEVVAVLIAETVRPVDERTAEDLRLRLAPHAVPLQAALLFGHVRDTATSQERQRIAREVHDGVAQDVASLGYLVDNLAGVATDDLQRDLANGLRAEITRIVGDLRHSIFDLRQEVPAVTALGEALSAYANRVAATSPMAVHVTVDEDDTRLPAYVELELLRIGQEAMANARKHSDAANLWVRCTVRPPFAEIEVADDGTRPHSPAGDSHGLQIMRERASSIDADLVVEAPSPGRPGTRVRVATGAGVADRATLAAATTRRGHADSPAHR